jgi:hypothetical protein
MDERSRPFHGFWFAFTALGNPLMFLEHTIDSAGRAGNGEVKLLQGQITREKILNGFRPRRPSQSFRRLISNGENGLFHQRIETSRRVFWGTRFSLKDLVESHRIAGSVAQPPAPFFDPTHRAIEEMSQLRGRAMRMLLHEMMEIDSICVV